MQLAKQTARVSRTLCRHWLPNPNTQPGRSYCRKQRHGNATAKGQAQHVSSTLTALQCLNRHLNAAQISEVVSSSEGAQLQDDAPQPGLLGIPGLSQPEDWQALSAQAQQALQQCASELLLVLQEMEEAHQPTMPADKEYAAGLVLHAVNTVDGLLTPSKYCMQNHPERRWRTAAAEAHDVAEQMSAELQQLLDELQQHPLFQDEESMVGIYSSREPISTSIHAAAQHPTAHAPMTSMAACIEDSGQQDEYQQVISAMAELHDLGDYILSAASGGPMLLLHPQQDVHLTGQELMDMLQRLSKQHDDEAQGLWPHPQHDELMQAADAMFGIGSSSGSESGSDSTSSGTVLEAIPLGPEQLLDMPAGLGALSLGPRVWLSPAAYSALQRTGPRAFAGVDFAILPLGIADVMQLLAEQPQAACRQLVYQAGLLSRITTVCALVDALRLLRHKAAQLQGYPSWSHLTLEDTSAGSPDAILAVLRDMAQAWNTGAVEHAVKCREVLRHHDDWFASRQTAAVAGTATRNLKKYVRRSDQLEPSDLDFAMRLMLGTDSADTTWSRRLVHLFPVEHVLSQGLSKLLQPAGLAVQLSECQQGELWTTGIKLIVLDTLNQTSGWGSAPTSAVKGKPIGVIYVVPDYKNQLAFTALVRPATLDLADSKKSIDTHGDTSSLVHVALHMPAHTLQPLASMPAWHGLPDPSSLRTLMHEVGHALSFILSLQGHAACQECVSNAQVEVAELASHVMERCVCDPGSVAALARVRPGTTFSATDARALARCMASPHRTWSPLELQQHVLLAFADVVMHSSEVQERSCTDILARVWQQYGSLKQPVFTQRLVSLLPSLIHLSGGAASAYPMAELIAAALWHCCQLEHPLPPPNSSATLALELPVRPSSQAAATKGWLLVRQQIFEASASVRFHQVVRRVFGASSIMNTKQGGRILDLACDVFQELPM